MDRDFFWGAATSAFQVEGAHLAEGKGLSIWDVFCRKKGKICDNSNADSSCNHYYRLEEDLDLMQAMNLRAYRFSISWPRVIPAGRGDVNSKGLDFYDRLVDGLLERGITPFPTLYHFDLPYELHLMGGWKNRDMAEYFTDYTEVMVRRLSDRVKYWNTLNEPLTAIGLGYFTGFHAPGCRGIGSGRRALHHMLLGHGRAVERIKSLDPLAKVGLTNIIYPIHPLREKDTKAVQRANKLNRLFMDPVFKGTYPDMGRLFTPGDKEIKDGDMQIISHPVDYAGINVYTRAIVRNSLLPTGFRPVRILCKGENYTDMGWEVYPNAMHDALQWVSSEYGSPEIYIMENGAAFEDTIENGRIRDTKRTEYLQTYIASMEAAIRDGINVRGYFVWSLFDNFEWTYGYTKKYGLVHVDPCTGKRTIKDSGKWYRELCLRGGLCEEETLLSS